MSHRTLLAAAMAAFMAATAPAALVAQDAKVTVCKDGTTTTATGEYRCSEHGGVDKNATKMKNAKTGAEKVGTATEIAAKNTSKTVSKAAEDAGKGAKAAEKEAAGDVTNATAAGATAKCKDGTYSHAHQHNGACAKHGGVSMFLDGTPPTD